MSNDTKVIIALEDDKYKWRTVDDVAKEVKLPVAEVKTIFSRLEDFILKSSIKDTNGNELYTTREHYLEKSSFIDRLLNSLSGIIK